MPNLPTTRYVTTPAALMSNPSLHELVLRRRVDHAVQQIAAQTRVRAAAVRADAAVAEAKIAAAAHVTREAAVSATMLRHYAESLAGGDALLRDELRGYEALFHAGASQALADLFTTYRDR
ncbi:MAG TPA: hypothetical protein VNA20_16315 [Frankiaceae bacterium]|nr:hypothetical protein [Frankiaceae bacterium]